MRKAVYTIITVFITGLFATAAVAQTKPGTVSGARPDIEPPTTEAWYCWLCGTPNPFAKEHYKHPAHRPMLSGPARLYGLEASLQAGSTPLPSDLLEERSIQLQLSDEQIARLHRLSAETSDELERPVARLDTHRHELAKLLQSGSEDRVRIKRTLSAVARERVSIEAARIANWIEAREVLTDEQRRALAGMFPAPPPN